MKQLPRDKNSVETAKKLLFNPYPEGEDFYRTFRIHGIEIVQRLSDNYINITYLDFQRDLIDNTRKKNVRPRHARWSIFLHRRSDENLNRLRLYRVISDEVPAVKTQNRRGGRTCKHGAFRFVLLLIDILLKTPLEHS